MLDKGQDNSLLRFSLGKAYLDQKDYDNAAQHLEKAIEFDSQYSAAWKLLGRCLISSGDTEKARFVLEKGIKIAKEKGDMQALREMQVFLRRIE